MTRSNLTQGRAFRHFAGAFGEPMSKQVVSAHLLHTASTGDRGRKLISCSARGDLQDLKGI